MEVITEIGVFIGVLYQTKEIISSFLKSREKKKFLKSHLEYVVEPIAERVKSEFEELIESILEFSRRSSLSCEEFDEKFEKIYDALQNDSKKALIEIIKIYRSDPENFRKIVKNDFIVISIERMSEAMDEKGEDMEMNDFVEAIEDMKLPDKIQIDVQEWVSIMEQNLQDVDEERIICIHNIIKIKKENGGKNG